MLKELFEFLFKKVAKREIDHNGVKWTNDSFHPIDSRPDWVDPLAFTSLTGMVAYLASAPDQIKKDNVFLTVDTSSTVTLRGGWRTSSLSTNADEIIEHQRNVKRIIFAEATAISPVEKAFRFNTYYPLEDMIIKVSTLFEKDDNRQNLLRTLSSVTKAEGIEMLDDGISTRVVMNTGVNSKSNEEIRVFHSLRAFRTFTEIEHQPTEVYLLRLRGDEEKGIEAALFNAGGMKWVEEAKQSIADWLNNALIESGFDGKKKPVIPVIY